MSIVAKTRGLDLPTLGLGQTYYVKKDGTVYGNTSRVVTTQRKTFSGSYKVNTEFASLKRAGRLVPSLDCNLIKQDVIYPTGTMISLSGSDTRYDIGTQSSSWVPLADRMSASQESNLQARANLSALNKLRRLSANLPVTVAEGRKTIQQVTSTARRLASAYNAIRHGRVDIIASSLGIPLKQARSGRLKRSGGIRTHQEAGKMWLEYTYGWVPLVSDVRDILISTYSVFNEFDKPVITGRGKARANLSRVRKDTWVSVTPEVQTFVSAEGVAVVSLTATVNNQTAAQFGSVGLGLLDATTVAWEVMPYSFVVDWFLPIGSWLQALSATQNLTFVDGSCTFGNQGLAQSYSKTHVSLYQKGSFWESSNRYTTTRRVVYSSFPSVFQSLAFKKPFNFEAKGDGDWLSSGAKHLISAIALLGGAFGRRITF